MLSEGRSQTVQVRLSWASQKRWGSREVTHEGGHLWGQLIQSRPQGQDQESRPETPKTRHGYIGLGPFGPTWNSPSTVFFLKRDAMVRDPPARPGSARLGPVRPATGKKQEGKAGPWRVRSGEAYGQEKRAGSPRKTRRGRYPRSLPQPSLPELR